MTHLSALRFVNYEILNSIQQKELRGKEIPSFTAREKSGSKEKFTLIEQVFQRA